LKVSKNRSVAACARPHQIYSSEKFAVVVLSHAVNPVSNSYYKKLPLK